MIDLTRWKRKKKYKLEKRFEPRLKIVTWAFLIFAVLIGLRLFDFQIIKFDFYYALASDQHEIYRKLFPERGSIFLKDKAGSILTKQESLYPIAINKDYNLVYAQPKFIEDEPEYIADKLAPILEPDEEKQEGFKNGLIVQLSKSDDPYEPLRHRVEDSQLEMIENLNITGIKSIKETFRYYPEKNIGSNVLGFVSFRGDDEVKKGQYGIEGYFNEELSGQQGEVKSESDISGRFISISDKDFVRAKDGADIVLTLDKTVQYEVCAQLNQHAEIIEAEGAAAVVMDPQTGEIIAMCSYPDFDPNQYNQVENQRDYNNRAVFEAYEVGSIFKPITMAAGLDLGVLTPETTYIDDGFVKIDEFTIRNSDKEAHGKNTMTQVLEKSLNTGTIFAVREIGQRNFRKYVEKFGFGERTGLQLDTEVAGNISSLKKKGEIFAATGSFGQGITATPLQMVQAISAIANGGKLVKPYIVEEVRQFDGTVIKTNRPRPKQVISSKTSTLLTGMMVSVVKNGQGQNASVPGYYIAGKTGTAQIAAGGVYSNRTNHSFIGFGPIKDPKFAMIIRFENPKKGSYSSVTTAPLFSRLAKFILDYYHVVPDAL
jgi:cell division protein FtsI/penicillin-binding protein 2